MPLETCCPGTSSIVRSTCVVTVVVVMIFRRGDRDLRRTSSTFFVLVIFVSVWSVESSTRRFERGSTSLSRGRSFPDVSSGSTSPSRELSTDAIVLCRSAAMETRVGIAIVSVWLATIVSGVRLPPWSWKYG